MLKQLVDIYDRAKLEDYSVFTKNIPALDFDIDTEYNDYTLSLNKGEKENKITAFEFSKKRTSGITPRLLSDQISYVFSINKERNEAYLDLLDNAISEMPDKKELSYLKEAIVSVNNILAKDSSNLNELETEIRELITFLSDQKFVNITFDGQNIIETDKDIIKFWSKLQRENVKTGKITECSVCGRKTYISSNLPKVASKYFASNNECGKQYKNTDSQICIYCSGKITTVLNLSHKHYLDSGEKIFYYSNNIDEIDNNFINFCSAELYLKDIKSRKEKYKKPENVEFLIITKDISNGRSVYYTNDVIDNIYNFFTIQEKYLPGEKYYSINSLKAFFMVNSWKEFPVQFIEKQLIKFAYTGKVDKQKYIYRKLLHKIRQDNKVGNYTDNCIDIAKAKIILEMIGVETKMREELKPFEMLGKVLSNMSRVQYAKGVHRTYIVQHAHRLINNPMLFAEVLNKFTKNYPENHINIDGWTDLVKKLPDRKMTLDEQFAFYVGIEEQKQMQMKKKTEEKEIK